MLCLAIVVSLLAAVSGAAPALAGEDAGLCNADHSRFTPASDFYLPVCFDGKRLIIHNTTNLPLNIVMTGDVGMPKAVAGGDQAAWLVDQFSNNMGDLMPDYRMMLPVGAGAVTIHVQGSASNRAYCLPGPSWRRAA
jgi:hypothetical protein